MKTAASPLKATSWAAHCYVRFRQIWSEKKAEEQSRQARSGNCSRRTTVAVKIAGEGLTSSDRAFPAVERWLLGHLQLVHKNKDVQPMLGCDCGLSAVSDGCSGCRRAGPGQRPGITRAEATADAPFSALAFKIMSSETSLVA